MTKYQKSTMQQNQETQDYDQDHELYSPDLDIDTQDQDQELDQDLTYKNKDKKDKNKFIMMYNKLLEAQNKQNELYKETKEITKKLLHLYHMDMKRRPSNRKNGNMMSQSGFNKPFILNEDFARLINVKPNTVMTQPKYRSELSKVIEKRGLYYTNDKGEINKRVYRADAEILALFDLPESVNLLTSEYEETQDKEKKRSPNQKGFNFYTIQTIIANIFRKKLQEAVVDKSVKQDLKPVVKEVKQKRQYNKKQNQATPVVQTDDQDHDQVIKQLKQEKKKPGRQPVAVSNN